MRAGRCWWSGVGWAARLRDATAPTVRCSPRRSAEHQLAMATCDSDADDQIMNLQTSHALRGCSVAVLEAVLQLPQAIRSVKSCKMANPTDNYTHVKKTPGCE